MSIVASLKRPPVDVGGFEAEVRLTSGSVHLLWDDPDRGVWIWVHGRIPSDDLLKVARSLR